jgi:hypothetical protein
MAAHARIPAVRYIRRDRLVTRTWKVGIRTALLRELLYVKSHN